MLTLRQIWVIANDISHTLFGSPALRDVARGSTTLDLSANVTVADGYPGYPDFSPTGSNIDHFRCQYPSLKGWQYCGGSEDQSCWLRNPDTGEKFTIDTNYETQMPVGIDRYITLDVSDGWINADGLNFTEAKLFNNTFPGPLIEACWGDTVHINVTNSLGLNGTSIHWHGLRQHNTMHMDGVNGLTQCPIAPDDYFVYIWNATQYGSSWYHAHYSVQYADGLQAPITIHGPTVSPYDEAIEPLIVTDWLHNGAFNALYQGALVPDILLGGVGNAVGDIHRFNNSETALLPVPKPYEIHFDNMAPNPVTRAKRYLLRLINTSWQTTFVFSIDNHLMTIVEADFVPVTPFNTSSLLVSIGQRYNIIVEASPTVNASNPDQNPLPKDCNFWVRAWVAGSFPGECGQNGTSQEYSEAGILRYDAASTSNPTSQPWNINLTCSDTDTNLKLRPVVPWTVGQPANGKADDNFNVSLLHGEGPYGTSFISLDRAGSDKQDPFQTDYGNPTFLNLDNVQGKWPVGWVVVPENYTDNDWVHLVLFGALDPENQTYGPHPIHLHGHDFAILRQVDNEIWDPATYDPSKNNLDNPPRRDVVLLPAQGYVIIGFKTDNPGVWLMHCHIAFHAAGGLSMQIMERQGAANEFWPPGNSADLDEANRLCANWNSWAYDCRNFWPGEVPKLDKDGNPTNQTHWPACENAVMLQNDSGV
ncbi:hypothetical protein CkaCkLH20_12661 [Colletotrichum karsti]|uniref:Laccase n=1 Tax=Colletotrichum karsti TaxID=1095194 RepID=A0A9P6HSD7_9PEZI|nr:uncharacterized protein CkaCkLH20_12661 [Colletotrichum karsti]KAF9869862.1 hypothetical protein CkaCkLH20_12661 [Colletotrichum karsti]